MGGWQFSKEGEGMMDETERGGGVVVLEVEQ